MNKASKLSSSPVFTVFLSLNNSLYSQAARAARGWRMGCEQQCQAGRQQQHSKNGSRFQARPEIDVKFKKRTFGPFLSHFIGKTAYSRPFFSLGDRL
ncbi:MAG: hypothetical protein IIC59_12095 [Proteobacteria bacterium]|nr:hypothetical protein [Pseudomonadota bacterium]